MCEWIVSCQTFRSAKINLTATQIYLYVLKRYINICNNYFYLRIGSEEFLPSLFIYFSIKIFICLEWIMAIKECSTFVQYQVRMTYDIVLELQKMLKLDAANVISVLKKIWFQL